MRFTPLAAFAVLLHSSIADSASDDKKHHVKPCTIRSPNTDRYFDLNAIDVNQMKPHNKRAKEETAHSWHARGYDYGANFTLNFCGPVVEKLDDVEDISKSHWRNISAFYTKGGNTYSIGMQNPELVFRGRKLVLNYTDGSYCDSSIEKRALLHSHEPETIRASKSKDPEDDDEDDDKKKGKEPTTKKPTKSGSSKSSERRRKNTIISFLCEKDPLQPLAAVSYVGTSPDECTYFFEARSSAACGGIEKETQQLGPGGVFGVIALIAVLVYLIGGCVYQRTVMHQRGWRQLPNYAMWASIGGFFSDMFVIMTSSCARFLPSRRGYSRVTLNGSDRGRGGRHAEDENRLIDQLDEEWDD